MLNDRGHGRHIQSLVSSSPVAREGGGQGSCQGCQIGSEGGQTEGKGCQKGTLQRICSSIDNILVAVLIHMHIIGSQGGRKRGEEGSRRVPKLWATNMGLTYMGNHYLGQQGCRKRCQKGTYLCDCHIVVGDVIFCVVLC